jgi:PAS domain S-box-containing protein
VILAVAAVLPLAVFASLLAYAQARNESAERERALRETARALALAVDEFLAGVTGSLQVLASAQLFERPEGLATFATEASRLLLQHEGWQDVVLLGADGEIVGQSADDPVSIRLLEMGRPVVERVMVTGAAAVSRLSVDVPGEAPWFAVGAPVRRGDRTRYVVLARHDVSGIERMLRRQTLPRAWSAVVVDHEGHIVSETVISRDAPGRIPPARLLQDAVLRPGWHRIDRDDGASYLALERSPISWWGVGISVPTSVVDRPFWRSVLVMIAAGLLCLVAGAFVAAILGRQLARPLGALARAASRLDRGERLVIPDEGWVREIAALAGSFQGAADAVAERARIRQQVAALAAFAPVGLIRTDPEGRATYVNERWTEITGLTLDDAEAAWTALIHPDDRPRLLEEWARAQAGGGEMATEFRYRRPDAEAYRWVAGSARPVRGATGRPVEYIGMIMDITERKRVEQERDELMARAEAARAEAEAANRAKDEFLATLSHELRTPLNALLLWVQVLREGASDPEMHGRALEAIERSARQQARLVEDLLDVARLSSGKFTVEPRPMDVVAAVRQAIETARGDIEQKGIELVVDLRAETCWVTGDEQRLQQVLLNLLSNASRFTPAGGRIEVRLESGTGEVSIQVRDTGEGIAAEALPFVFDRFRQAEGGARRRHGGLGLGLAIARDIVELHRGRISVESGGKGQGAAFSIALPALPEGCGPEPTRPALAPLAEPGRGEMATRLDDLVILLVEDDEDACELVTRALALLGAQVVPTTSGRQALAMLEQLKPDVVISDIGMPEMDGYEFARRMRATPTGGALPAVALTGYASTDDRAKAIAAGFQAHVAKPVDTARLARLLARLTRKR